jgi:lipopolysaccharide export system protein LptC
MPNKSAKHRHPFPPGQRLTRTSNAMAVLYFAKSLNRPFTYEDLATLNPTKFNQRNKRMKYTERLQEMNLLNKVSKDTYQITEEGIKYVYMIGAYYAQFN